MCPSVTVSSLESTKCKSLQALLWLLYKQLMSKVVDNLMVRRSRSILLTLACLMPRYVLTQFNSHTLNTHIAENYPPIVFGGPQKRGFVDVLTASQTPKSANWYKGSADAVRQQLDSILDAFRGMSLPDELLVLSGQAIYKMVMCGLPDVSCPCMLPRVDAPGCRNAM